MNKMIQVSVIVTVYSETSALVETVGRLLKSDRGHICEIILTVSPKSSKECIETCNKLVDKYKVVKMHIQKRTPGVGWAIREGMRLVKGDYVALLSADLETEPEAVGRMIKKIEETGCDGVIGNRWLKGGGFINYDKTKLVLNYIFQKVFRFLFNTKLGDLTYGLKILSREICRKIKWEGTLHEIYIETTIKPLSMGYRIEQVPTVWIGRTEGESKNVFSNNLRYIKMAINVLWTKVRSGDNLVLRIVSILLTLLLLANLRSQIVTGYAKESWQVTEWLINYQGGFVRRGLPGELIWQLHNLVGLNPYITIISISLAAYLSLSIFFIKSFIDKGYALYLAPFVFFLGNPIINNFWVRKDIIVILVLILAIVNALKKNIVSLVIVNLVFILGILTHESIGFFGIPIIVLILARNGDRLWQAIIKLLPSIGTFVACLYYKGNLIIANEIWDSWSGVTFSVQNLNFPDLPSAIDALSWSLNRGILYTNSYIFANYNNHIYAPVAWLGIFVLTYSLLVNFNKSLSRILIFQFLTIVPLLILGADYGRWVFLWVCSSVSIWLLIPSNLQVTLYPRLIEKISDYFGSLVRFISDKYTNLVPYLCLIIGVPYYGWDLISYYETTPIMLIFRFVKLYL